MKFKKYRLNCDDSNCRLEDENEDLMLNDEEESDIYIAVTDDDIKHFDHSVYVAALHDIINDYDATIKHPTIDVSVLK